MREIVFTCDYCGKEERKFDESQMSPDGWYTLGYYYGKGIFVPTHHYCSSEHLNKGVQFVFKTNYELFMAKRDMLNILRTLLCDHLAKRESSGKNWEMAKEIIDRVSEDEKL